MLGFDFESLLCFILLGWLWKSDRTSMGLRFLIIEPGPRLCLEMRWVSESIECSIPCNSRGDAHLPVVLLREEPEGLWVVPYHHCLQPAYQKWIVGHWGVASSVHITPTWKLADVADLSLCISNAEPTSSHSLYVSAGLLVVVFFPVNHNIVNHPVQL